MGGAYSTGESLRTIGPDGIVPDCRMRNARATQDFARRLFDNDCKRSFKRSRVNGLVDGNPPYKASKLAAANRRDACNANWGTARSYMESGSGSFYDLSSEAPSAITYRTSYGRNEQEKERFSSLISEGLDVQFKKDKTWDYQMQISQWEMVLHGVGPFFFEDTYGVFPRAVLCNDLKVPEFTKSDTQYWEAAVFFVDNNPPQMYEFVRNEEAAAKVGWNVEYTKRCIYNAIGIKQQRGISYDWEFFQQEMKNNSFEYVDDDSKVVRLAHVFWKEFDGRITHAIVERETNTASAAVPGGELKDSDIEYLYLFVGKYANWQEATHPMYYDHGNGGYHHSVTGLGVKMYSAMEYENRLICNLCDKAFAPKILFKPTTTEASQKFQLATYGDYGVLPPGTDAIQNPIAGIMQDGLAMRQELKDVMNSTLSAYKQGAPTQKTGNPVTKFEKQLEAAMQSAMSKTQFNRYYKQLDMLYAEIARRFCDLNSTDERAKEFQAWCEKQGVPREALGRCEYVGATRVVGQGSAFMRKQAIDSLFPIAGSLPEDGREKLIQDKIAAEAGQSAVTRYYPRKAQPMADDQQADALVWVGMMKIGMQAVVTSEQNAITHAATYLNAASQSLQSLQRGADPHEVAAFLDRIGPAIVAQLKRVANDPTRKDVVQAIFKQWKQLASVSDKLKKSVQQMDEQRKQQQQKTGQVMTDEQIKSRKAQSDIAIKQAKTQAQLKQSEEKHRLKLAHEVQDMAISDSKAASEIHINRLRAFSNAGDN